MRYLALGRWGKVFPSANACLSTCDKETPRFSTAALGQLARALAEGARPQANQE
eukprot:IDg5315t1